MDGATLGEKKNFKAYRIKTEGLIQKIANSLTDFEKSKDPQKLYDGVKESLKRFSST